MSEQTLFHSKKFFYFNLVLVGIIAGFLLALFTFSCSTRIPAGDIAQAQQTPVSLNEPASMGGPPSFRAIVKKVLPVVVEVNVTDIIKQPVPDVGQGFPFNFLFPPGQGNNPPQSQQFKQEGLGSGVIVQRNGDTYYVLTNNHVVGKASTIEVTLYNNQKFTAKLVGTSVRKDLALISFQSSDHNLPIAQLGNSNDAQVGDWVLAIGNPFGFMSTVTAGIISAKGRTGVGPGNTIDQFIQTDAAINKGNSGGALVNMAGQVIGINDWIVAPSGGSVGLGFAIAINDAKRAITDFIEHGSVQYGWLGVSVQDPATPELAKQLGVEGKPGSLVYHVFLDSPAAKGGIQPGDYITAINGTAVQNTEDLIRTVGDLSAGQKATFSIIRYGHPMSTTVTIGLRGTEQQINENRKLWPGISVVPLDSQIRQQLSLASTVSGLVVASVIDKTPASIPGIQQGDIVRKINNEPIANAIDFYRAINQNTSSYNFQIERQGSTFNIAISK